MKIEGHAVCLPSDIDTDLIIAGRYLRTKDRSIWAEKVFEDHDPGLSGRLKGAVIVAGKNFGCGSSREQAAVALKEAGVVGVVAPSFARIFFRNAINIGLPLAEADLPCSDGERVVIDLISGRVYSGSLERPVAPLSGRMLDILSSGGLIKLWRKRKI
jgi:methanogen homoaconitase small subunit